MPRITTKNLEAVVDRINQMTKSPMTPWEKDDNGKMHANIGNYHLSGAYGGWKLERVVSDCGGVEDVLRCGYCPKRELYDLMQSFIRGLEATK